MYFLYEKLLFLFEGCQILNAQEEEFITYILSAIRLSIPALLLILIGKDLMTATMAGKEDDIKKAQKDMIKRLIIAVVIYFLPTIINVTMSLSFPEEWGACRVGW